MAPARIFDSKTVLYLIAILMVFQFFSIKRYNSPLLWANEMGAYYAYLPAYHVWGDLTLEKTPIEPALFERFYYPRAAENGGWVFKTTMGIAILQTPFFLIAQFLSLNLDYPVDGYSSIYRYMAVFSAIFYSFWGLFFLRRSLSLFFSDFVVSIVLVSLLLGTNLYYYTFYETGMTHVYTFFLVSLFTWLTLSWHWKSKPWKLILLALVLGLVTLIRPVNVCIGLFFLLYRDKNQNGLVAKFNLLLQHKLSVALAAGVFFLPLIPQLLYWHHLTGEWFYYSYKGEYFYWLKPKIWLGLFSYQKGWLVWTPLMWFALLGLVLLRKQLKGFLLPILVLLPVYVYIIFSWWCWWYGGGFGMRPMIDIYPILAFPLAAFMEVAFQSKFARKAVISFSLFFILLNLFHTDLLAKGILHWHGTSKALYWELFPGSIIDADLETLIEEPSVEKAKQGESGLD